MYVIESWQRGGIMLVSAISAGSSTAKYLNSKGVDGSVETSGGANFLSKVSQNNDMTSLYKSINEWKAFCYSQMDKGKLDIIA
jgi:hypothetical protein